MFEQPSRIQEVKEVKYLRLANGVSRKRKGRVVFFSVKRELSPTSVELCSQSVQRVCDG